MSLTSCLKKAGAALRSEDKAAILARARELRGDGVKADEAGARAIREQLDSVSELLADNTPAAAPKSLDAKQSEFLRESAATMRTNGMSEVADKYDAMAVPFEQREAARVKAIAAESPDMLVVMPGKDQMQTVSDALKDAKAEHAMDASEADLVKAALECALGFGA